ncbi:nucleoside transporter C-terminal domain-containing protein [Staphylococcus aureus]
MAIIALLNGIVSNIFSTVSGGAISWDFQTLIGFVFAPFAFLVGVPWQDASSSRFSYGDKTIYLTNL